MVKMGVFFIAHRMQRPRQLSWLLFRRRPLRYTIYESIEPWGFIDDYYYCIAGCISRRYPGGVGPRRFQQVNIPRPYYTLVKFNTSA